MLLIDGDELKSRIVIVINSTVEGDETNDQLRVLSMIKHVLETAVEETPIIEAEPVIHAHWIPKYVSNGMTDLFECSKCSARARVEIMSDRCYFKRCHNCGARMDGKEGEE